MSQFVKQFLKAFGFLVALVLTTASIPGYAQAAATGTVSLRPGEKAQFTVEYGNGGEGTNTLTNALLYVYIGKELQLDPNSIIDQFPGDTGTPYKVVSTVVRTDTNWSSVIVYQPKSANNPNSPSGTNVAGNVDLPIGQKGTLKFSATLKADVLSRYAVGNVLVPDVINGKTEGIYSILDHSGTGKQPGQTGVTIAAPLATSSSSSAAPTCTKLASNGQATGGGFAKNIAQPVYSSITFNPNPGIIGSGLTVNTNGLKDAGCGTNLEGAPCSTVLQGPGNFSVTGTGSVTGGVCKVVFSASQTPKTVGTYQAVTTIQGPNGSLQTAPANIQFNLAAAPTVLARTGGLEIAAIAASVAAVGGGIAYFVSRRRKLKIGLKK